jgi:hypothetical protein
VQRPTTDDQWDELVSAIRGSCEWCKAVVHAFHLCELTVLEGVLAPVLFGVDEDSRYEQPPLILGKSATILISRDLLIESTNPAPDLLSKVAGFACVLAHEMAHHALTHEWRVLRRYTDVSGLALEDRRKVLAILGAGGLAKATGLPYDVIVNHWGIADNAMRARLIEIAADESDEYAIHAEDDSQTGQHFPVDEPLIQIAEEWSAAVVGCMMSYRLGRGYDYAMRLAQSALDDIAIIQRSNLVKTVLMAACQYPGAEATAISRAITTLDTAYNNPDVQECDGKLRESGLTWAALFHRS